jgi:hypothetical protein
LKPSQAGERSQTLVVRGAITVPTEGKKAHLTDCHAAVVADDALISQLLGDAENPAHTQWNERAEKLRANWTGAQYKFGATLLAPDTPAVALLDRLPDWQRVYSDDVAVVHKRRDAPKK